MNNGINYMNYQGVSKLYSFLSADNSCKPLKISSIFLCRAVNILPCDDTSYFENFQGLMPVFSYIFALVFWRINHCRLFHAESVYPWCNGYRRRKWTRRHEFKSWTRLIAFHIALILLGKLWIQLFSFQQWFKSMAD